MKKIMLISLILILLAGCSKPVYYYSTWTQEDTDVVELPVKGKVISVTVEGLDASEYGDIFKWKQVKDIIIFQNDILPAGIEVTIGYK